MKQLRSGSPNYLYISGMLVMFDALTSSRIPKNGMCMCRNVMAALL